MVWTISGPRDIENNAEHKIFIGGGWCVWGGGGGGANGISFDNDYSQVFSKVTFICTLVSVCGLWFTN